jgi:hypothetical protein
VPQVAHGWFIECEFGLFLSQTFLIFCYSHPWNIFLFWREIQLPLEINSRHKFQKYQG